MKLLSILLFASVLIGSTFQQPFAQRCFDSPSSWSGAFFKVDYLQGKSDRGYIFYNRTELRLHISYDSFTGTRDSKRVWLLYRERKVYTLDEDFQTCTADNLPPDELFPTFGAPRGAEYIHQDRLGSYITGLGVTTDYLRLTTESGGAFHGYYSPLTNNVGTDPLCIPVMESYEHIDTAPIHQRDTHWMYMNISRDPINPLVWEIPRECYQH